MNILDFRTVLTGLNDYRARGVSNFNSVEAANLFSISNAQGSKYLSRLHQMGFLKRTRNKRLSLSKKSKLCNKGYFYTYEFSKQGEQYLKWMSTGRSVEVVRYYDLVEELSPHLPKEVRDEILNIIKHREQSRYKGSNQSLQAVSYIIHAFPSISKTLKDTINRNDFLETENKKLNSQKKELQLKIEKLEKQNNDLKDKIEIENTEAEKRHLKLYQIIMLQNEMDFHKNASQEINNTTNGKTIKELSEVLLLKNFGSGFKIIEAIYKRYDNGRKVAKEHMNKALEASKEIQTLTQ